MRAFLTVCLAAFTAILWAGCVNHTEPAGPAQPLTRAEENFSAIWQASLDVLRENYFQPDRMDRRAGVISTLPQTGQQWWEFWRGDSITPEQKLESSIQTLYRTVEITLRPTASNADTWQAAVKVTVLRSDKPEMQITSTSEAYDLFITLNSNERRRGSMLIDYGGRISHEHATSKPNVDLGRDAELENKLAAEIQIKTARQRQVRQGQLPTGR